MPSTANAIPANDAGCLAARTPEHYRQAVAAIMATLPANDSDIGAVVACPTLARLAKRQDPRAATLLRWRDLTTPVPASLTAANDNDTDSDEFGVDATWEIRPSVEEAVTSAFRVYVRRTRSASGAWSEPEAVGGVTITDGWHRWGDLLFLRGAMVSWRTTVKGKPLAPVDRPRGAKGSLKAGRDAASVEAYLAIAGTPHLPDLPLCQLPSIEQVVDVAGQRAKDADAQLARQNKTDRHTLQELGVDGSVPFERAAKRVRRRAIRCPAFVHPAARWIGGVVHCRAGVSADNDQKLISEAEREMTAAEIRLRLPQALSQILDFAITRMTAKEIGEELGHRGKYAERAAVRLIDEAIDEFKNLAA